MGRGRVQGAGQVTRKTRQAINATVPQVAEALHKSIIGMPFRKRLLYCWRILRRKPFGVK